MGNFPRYIPSRSLVEVTTRTIQGRLLLVPSRDLNNIVCGVLGRALNRYSVELVHFVVMSNHVHLLLVPEDAESLASFMCFVNGNLAKEAGRLYRWREKFWSRRYRAVVVSDEPEAQVARLRYLLENGCKEGLVRSPRDWPGASGVEALLTGGAIRGWWFDRTAEYKARRRGETFSKYTHANRESFTLSPLPCWRSLPAEERQALVASLVREIEAETRARLREQGRSPMGRRRILRQNPHDKPESSSRSPAPRFHAATAAVRKSLELAFYEFRLWYRQAAEELQAGTQEVEFPPGCFPPGLPFCAQPQPP